MKKVHAAESVYIDPADCDSKVSYKITGDSEDEGERVSATVQLSDCNRTIDWYFNARNENSISKIDNAIKALTQFRKAYSVALTAHNREQKKEDKK